ncbi:hypothetical protein BaRGS_00018601 [Batillaria attramentaria]|uniref:Uncharacterized protein n=1 Tax=Batillaria attramentaria TaxID=370345 RepID=A0ABD0KS87_9CAEN
MQNCLTTLPDRTVLPDGSKVQTQTLSWPKSTSVTKVCSDTPRLNFSNCPLAKASNTGLETSKTSDKGTARKIVHPTRANRAPTQMTKENTGLTH